MVLREAAQRDSAQRYFAARPGIDYVGESIYPRTLVVAIGVPVGESKEALASQPFTRAVLPVLPLFFCH